jgi:hypothetical protein
VVKIPLSPMPEKFAKFAKFAKFDSAPHHPTPIHPHAPRLGTISDRPFSTPPPAPVSDGPGTREVGGVADEGFASRWRSTSRPVHLDRNVAAPLFGR